MTGTAAPTELATMVLMTTMPMTLNQELTGSGRLVDVFCFALSRTLAPTVEILHI